MNRKRLERSLWAIVRLALLLALITPVVAPEFAAAKAARHPVPSIFKNMQAMQVRLVRDSLAGCEPNCAEWISAEGDIVEKTPADFRRVLSAAGHRKLPIFVNSGGGSIEAAMSIGKMLRDKSLDVSVTRTAFEPCAQDDKACKARASRSPHGRPDSVNAYCASACTLLLAAGTRRLASPLSHVGVHQIVVYQTQIRIRRTYRVTTLQRPGGATQTRRTLIREQRQAGQTYEVNVDDSTYRPIETYLAHMGIDKALIPLMEATPNTTIHWMSHPELQNTHMVTEEVGGESLLAQPAHATPEPMVGRIGITLETVTVPAVYDGYAVNLTIGISAAQPGPTVKVSILAQGLPPVAGTTIPFIEVIVSPGRSVRAYRSDLATSQPIFESVGPLEPWCSASTKDLMRLSLGTSQASGPAAGGPLAEVPVGSIPGLGALLSQECPGRSAASN